MEVKTTQISEVVVSRDELEAIIASYVQAQLGGGGQSAVVSDIKFDIKEKDVNSVVVTITINFPKDNFGDSKPIFIKHP